METKKFKISNPNFENTIFGLVIGFLSILVNFNIAKNTHAEYRPPILSVSVDASKLSIDGNGVIESDPRTSEYAINLKAYTSNRTGYTISINSKTENTALLNTNPSITTKISSISTSSELDNFPDNTWGYKLSNNTDYSPIPAISAPANIAKTTEMTGSSDGDDYEIDLGMKLDNTLKTGYYENKLIISIISNPYQPKAIMTDGRDFNSKLISLEDDDHQIKYFKRSHNAPSLNANAVNVEAEDSDYAIKLWHNLADETVYYYTESEYIYLNEDSSDMFTSCDCANGRLKKILSIDLSSFNTENVANMSNMFSNLYSIKTLDVSHFDTKNVIDMSHMFDGAQDLEVLDVSSFNTEKVEDMSAMFYGLRILCTLNLINFDTKNVTDMHKMFAGMRYLTDLNISSFNTGKVTDMSGMFWGLHALLQIDVSHFNTKEVKDMAYMFCGLEKITHLNLSNFNTENVVDMDSMFYGMLDLAILDLSNFNTKKVENMVDIFSMHFTDAEKDKLQTIYVGSDFDTTSLTKIKEPGSYNSGMFASRNKLRGGAGSFLADPSTADKSWLRIDDPTNGRPGYFTRKP